MSSSSGWAQIAIAVVTTGAVIVAIVQIANFRSAAKRSAAFRYFERWSEAGALKFIAQTSAFLTVSDEGQKEDRWREWKTKELVERLQILLMINFWEELAGLYNARLVDQKVIRQYLGGICVELWELGEWFFERCQTENPLALLEWQAMYRNIKKPLSSQRCSRAAGLPAAVRWRCP